MRRTQMKTGNNKMLLHSCSAGCMECHVKSFSHGSHNETCNDAKEIKLLIALVLTTKKHITTYTLTIKQKKYPSYENNLHPRYGMPFTSSSQETEWVSVLTDPHTTRGMHPLKNMGKKNQKVYFIQYTFNTTLHSQSHFSFINVKSSCTPVTLCPPHC